MAFVADGSYNDSTEVIEGRPDFGDRAFGKSEAKDFPPYIFSVRGGSALVHRVSNVQLHWYRVSGRGERLVRVNRPLMIAHTVCSMSFRVQGSNSRMCMIPNPEALLCGRCHGEPATFGKHGKGTRQKIRRAVAHVKLGCVVNGY